MRWRLTLLALLFTYPVCAQTASDNDWAADEAVLKGQGLPTKGPEFLRVLRQRIPTGEVIDQFNKHVAHLGVAGYAERAKATADLVKMGPVVRPLLENLLLETKADAETVGRLRLVLEKFPADKDFLVVIAASRLLQRDKPADSLRTLLDFVPYATNELVRQEVQRAINAVVLAEGKPAPLLLETLKDTNPARRAAAGEAWVRLGKLADKEAWEPLLKDAHPLVRHQIGMALVETHDKRGVPLLIQSVAESPSDRAEFAVEMLYRVAGETAPAQAYEGKNSVKKFQAAWQKWHTQHQGDLDLAKALAKNEHAFTVIACMGVGAKAKAQNKILELGPDHATIRWEFEAGRYPLDLQILGPNRLLIAEYLDRRVTERDFKGNILWQHAAQMPIACQRLPNGHTFIATRQQLLIVDRDGKEVFTHFQQNLSITTANRLRNGQMVVVSSGGLCQLLDPKGSELKRFQLGQLYTMGGNVEILPNGRILAPLYTQGHIAEFDWDGTKHWQAAIQQPMSVARLSNGNTLVVCTFQSRVVEIDRTGKEVWSYRTEGRPYRARPR